MIREEILAELGRRRMSRTALANLLIGKVGRSTLYAFLAGKSRASSAVVEALLEALHGRLTFQPPEDRAAQQKLKRSLAAKADWERRRRGLTAFQWEGTLKEQWLNDQLDH